MVDNTNLPVLKEFIQPDAFTVRLLADDIIEIEWDSQVGEITKQHLEEVKIRISEFGNKRKMPVYISTFPFMSISSEAKTYAASEDGQEYTMANAVLIDNLGKKLIFNFFLKFNAPKTPTKAFQSKSQAIKWLLQIKSKISGSYSSAVHV